MRSIPCNLPPRAICGTPKQVCQECVLCGVCDEIRLCRELTDQPSLFAVNGLFLTISTLGKRVDESSTAARCSFSGFHWEKRS